MIALASVIILGIYTNLGIGRILLLSLVITATTYLIGDLLIFSLFNNATAAVGDAGLCWLIISTYSARHRKPPRLIQSDSHFQKRIEFTD